MPVKENMATSSTIALVLAAGMGTRMKSDRPKVLHEVFFAPMIHHVMDALAPLPLSRTIVVTGHGRAQVEASLASYGPTCVYQEKQLGTGHAVLSCEQELAGYDGAVLILCGDTPLIRTATLARFLAAHHENSSSLTVMTTEVAEPAHYGRIIRDGQGYLEKIVEEKDADENQRKIKEINAGIYCVDSRLLLDCLKRVVANNKQGELYLTDIVEIAGRDGVRALAFRCEDGDEVMGVNSRQEQARAHFLLQQRHVRFLLDSGVTILQPENVVIGKDVTIGRDSTIHPFTVLTGKTVIGSSVTVESFVTISDCSIADGVQVAAYSSLRGKKVPSGRS